MPACVDGLNPPPYPVIPLSRKRTPCFDEGDIRVTYCTHPVGIGPMRFKSMVPDLPLPLPALKVSLRLALGQLDDRQTSEIEV